MNTLKLTYWSKLVITTVSLVLLSPISSALALSKLSYLDTSNFSQFSQKQVLADKSDAQALGVTVATSSSPERKPAFTLYIWQPGGTISEVTARISIKSRYGDKYRQERFLGDYRYRMKQKANFVKGFKAGDIIIIRLYDTTNRLIGYSELPILPENIVVNLILSANPIVDQVVRTFYGADVNSDSIVDDDTTKYDYFTQLNNQKVTFLNSSENINITQYQAAGFSQIPTIAAYPISLSDVVGKSINIFDSNLAPALTAAPGSITQLIPIQENSSFELGQLLSKYRQIGVAKNIKVSFSDISKDYWAKEYISELAAMEIIGGFPDGSFRPNAAVTRGELAVLLQKVFMKRKIRKAVAFKDIPPRHWAYNAIRESYEMGFFNTLGSKKFNPKQKLTRLDILMTLAKGLNYEFTGSPENILSVYSDASTLKGEHRNFIASLTQNGVIVNYPNIKLLNTKKIATRADVCALLYRAMVVNGEVVDFPSRYNVKITR
ncbi:MAG: S-layer homology domain-containing protein [Dolichospermum sp.]